MEYLQQEDLSNTQKLKPLSGSIQEKLFFMIDEGISPLIEEFLEVQAPRLAGADHVDIGEAIREIWQQHVFPGLEMELGEALEDTGANYSEITEDLEMAS